MSPKNAEKIDFTADIERFLHGPRGDLDLAATLLEDVADEVWNDENTDDEEEYSPLDSLPDITEVQEYENTLLRDVFPTNHWTVRHFMRTQGVDRVANSAVALGLFTEFTGEEYFTRADPLNWMRADEGRVIRSAHRVSAQAMSSFMLANSTMINFFDYYPFCDVPLLPHDWHENLQVMPHVLVEPYQAILCVPALLFPFVYRWTAVRYVAPFNLTDVVHLDMIVCRGGLEPDVHMFDLLQGSFLPPVRGGSILIDCSLDHDTVRANSLQAHFVMAKVAVAVGSLLPQRIPQYVEVRVSGVQKWMIGQFLYTRAAASCHPGVICDLLTILFFDRIYAAPCVGLYNQWVTQIAPMWGLVEYDLIPTIPTVVVELECSYLVDRVHPVDEAIPTNARVQFAIVPTTDD